MKFRYAYARLRMHVFLYTYLSYGNCIDWSTVARWIITFREDSCGSRNDRETAGEKDIIVRWGGEKLVCTMLRSILAKEFLAKYRIDHGLARDFFLAAPPPPPPPPLSHSSSFDWALVRWMSRFIYVSRKNILRFCASRTWLIDSSIDTLKSFSYTLSYTV